MEITLGITKNPTRPWSKSFTETTGENLTIFTFTLRVTSSKA